MNWINVLSIFVLGNVNTGWCGFPNKLKILEKEFSPKMCLRQECFSMVGTPLQLQVEQTWDKPSLAGPEEAGPLPRGDLLLSAP